MRYDRFFTKLFCTPLLLEAGFRAGLERTLLAYMSGTPADLSHIKEFQPAFEARKVQSARADKYADELLEVDGSTAYIHVDGPIDRHLSALDRLCFEATDINDLDRAIARVSNDAAIRNVMFCINSPGGTVNGVPETAGRISALGQRKNTLAMIDGLGCSAAFWLACACHQVVSTPSSMSGSVGVYLALLDQSRHLEAEGLRVETIKDGKLKAAGASWKPLSEEERAHFQETVNQIGAMFRAAVNSRRPEVSAETMQGQSFFGESAVRSGLVDALVSDRAEALALMA